MTTIIKVRRDTAANWTSVNPILASGEPGLETDTLAVKYGDGVTAWVDLPYGTIEAALTVINPAQANITSVGTLTSLSVSGNVKTANLSASGNVAFTGANVSLGNIANLHIGGGTANYVLSTDGTGNLTWKVDATNNLGNIVIDGDDITSSNDVVNILADNYAQIQSNNSYVWVEKDGAYIEVANGDTWHFNYDGTISFPDYTIKTGPNGPGQYFTTQNLPNSQTVTNINPDGDNVVIVSKTSFPDITLVDAGWTLYFNNRPYPVNSVVNGSPVADNFYITLGNNTIYGPAEIPQDASVQVGLIENHNWWFDFEGSTQVPGNIYIGTSQDLNINGSHTNGVSINSDGFSQLYWVPNIADTANVNPNGGGNVYSRAYADGAGFSIASKDTGNSIDSSWIFRKDGKLTMPDVTQLVSGGIGTENNALLGTYIETGPSNYVWWNRDRKGQYIVIDTDRALTVYAEPLMVDHKYPVFSSIEISSPNKVMFSYYIDLIQVSSGLTSIGVGNASANLTTPLGNDTNSIAIADNGPVYLNGNLVLTGDNFMGGNNVDVAIDRDNDLIWFRVDSNFWNADDAADPTTGTGGIDISSITGTLYPAVTLGGSVGGSQTAALKPNLEAPNTVPTGFTFIFPEPSSVGNVITFSNLYTVSGAAMGDLVTDRFGNSIAMHGVNDFPNTPNFAGVIASEPDVDNYYQVGTDGDNIIYGAATQGGSLRSTDYRTAIGVLNAGNTVNGLYADQTGTIMSGGANNTSSIWALDDGIGINNTLYPRQAQSIDLGTPAKTFDSLYVNNVSSPTELTIGAGNDYSYWINMYGDIGDLTNFYDQYNTTQGAGVVYDSDGNLYVIGQCYNQDSPNMDTLALKYDPDGNLLWRKSWIDDNGDMSGSFNQAFVMSNDILYWMSSTSFMGTNNSTYIGKMNLDGVITTASAKIGGGYNGIDLVADGNTVYFVGYSDNGSNNLPFVASLNTSTNSLNWGKRYYELAGQFNSVTTDNSGNLWAAGTLYESMSYSMLTQFGSDGTVYNTIKVLDTWGSDTVGSAVGYNNGYVYVVSITANTTGGFVVSKYNLDISAGVIWSKRIYIGTEEIDAYDISFDGNSPVITGITHAYGNNDFYVIKLNSNGVTQWQRRLSTGQNEGSGWTGSRMAEVYNNRIAVTGYTDIDPVTGGQLANDVSITLQLPTDGSGTGQYNNNIFQYNIEYYTVESISAISTVLPIIPESVTPTVTDNNGFIPNTILKNPNYYPVRIEINSDLDTSWRFDTEGFMHLPGGAYIESYNTIASLRNNNHRIGVDTDYAIISSTYQSSWKFYGDSGYRSLVQYSGLENRDVHQEVQRISAGSTETVWIARNKAVTGTKFTAHVDRGTGEGSYYRYFETMVCEIVLAVSKNNAYSTKAVASVYAITNTAEDLLVTFDAAIVPGGTYTGVTTNNQIGTGAGAEFTVIANEQTGSYSISVTNGGSNYNVGDVIIINGSNVGGNNNENNITITVTAVDGGEIISTNGGDGITYAGRAMLTCTAIDPTNDCYIKINARETSSPAMEYDWYC